MPSLQSSVPTCPLRPFSFCGGRCVDPPPSDAINHSPPPRAHFQACLGCSGTDDDDDDCHASASGFRCTVHRDIDGAAPSGSCPASSAGKRPAGHATSEGYCFCAAGEICQATDDADFCDSINEFNQDECASCKCVAQSSVRDCAADSIERTYQCIEHCKSQGAGCVKHRCTLNYASSAALSTEGFCSKP
jgi:hypothetical protein